MNKSKGASFLFSLLPGAGHMYLGLKRQGIELMLMFFLTIFISDSLRLSFFVMFLPIIWFYSIFDVMEKVKSETPLLDGDLPIFQNINYGRTVTSGNLEKYMAYALIICGILSLANNIIFPIMNQYIDYRILQYARTIVVSSILIIIGLFLLSNNRKVKNKVGEDSCKQEELEP